MEKTPLELAIINLWHISRTALAASPTVPSRYDRMIYVKNELTRTYPELIAGMKSKHVWFKIEDVTSPTQLI